MEEDKEEQKGEEEEADGERKSGAARKTERPWDRRSHSSA